MRMGKHVIFFGASLAILALGACGQGGAPKAEAGKPAAAQAKGGCPGFDPRLSAAENVKRAGWKPGGVETGPAAEASAKDLLAALAVLPEWAPIYPCATQIAADTPPDGSGVIGLTFEAPDDMAKIAQFYADKFQGHGKVEQIKEDGPKTVLTVTLEGTPSFEVHVMKSDGEEGAPQTTSVVLRGEGLK